MIGSNSAKKKIVYAQVNARKLDQGSQKAEESNREQQQQERTF